MNLLKFLPYLYIAALIAAGWYVIDKFTPVLAPYAPATVSPQIERVPTITIEPKKVRVYAPQAKKKLGLTITAQQDNSVHVISATEVKPSPRQQIIVTTLNSETGETETLVRPEPLPWFKVERGGELRLEHGYKGKTQITRLTLRHDLIQIKALHAGINASVDSDGQVFAGIGFGWKW